MKKKILLVGLLMCFCATQTNAQKVIDGVGKLKLGSSPSVLSEIGYNLDKVIKVDDIITYSLEVSDKYTGDDFYQLFPDKKNNATIGNATYHPSVKVFYLPKYKPIEGLTCYGLTLKYFNDALYYISTENPKELEDAFELKYGKPQIDTKEEEKYYVDGHGTEIIKTDQTKISEYETGNPKITCFSVLKIWHDSKGKESSLYYFNLYIQQIFASVRDYDKSKQKETEEQQEKEKLNGLDGL